MKKAFTVILCAVLLLATCLLFAACSSQSTSLIDFGKKYMADEDSYYAFHSDGTGVYHHKYVYEYEANPSWNYTLSGSVDFVWREASNGGIYLFHVESHYNEDHTEGHTLGVATEPFYFSEDFLTYTSFGQYGDTQNVYIKEGSELESILDK